LQEQAEAGYYKPESHERQTGANPGEKGSFRREIIGWSTGWLVCHTFCKWSGSSWDGVMHV
jgi:hypothetical protein